MSAVPGMLYCILHYCVALFDGSWQLVWWEDHPSSWMTFPSSPYHSLWARPSHVTLRWLSSSFFHFCAQCRNGTKMYIEDAVAEQTAQAVREDTCKLSGSLIMKKEYLWSVSVEPRRSMSCAAGFQGFRLAPDWSLSQTDRERGAGGNNRYYTEIWIHLIFSAVSQCHNGQVALLHA